MQCCYLALMMLFNLKQRFAWNTGLFVWTEGKKMKKLGNARIIACLEQRLGRVSGKGMLQLPSQTSSGCWDTIQKVLFVLVALRRKVSSSQHMACKYWSPRTPFTCFPFACLGKGYKMVFLQCLLFCCCLSFQSVPSTPIFSGSTFICIPGDL